MPSPPTHGGWCPKNRRGWCGGCRGGARAERWAHTDRAMDWESEIAYVYDVLCREVSDTPLLSSMTYEDFVDFCLRLTPGARAGGYGSLDSRSSGSSGSSGSS